MPDANTSDEAVLARLRSVLPGDDPAAPPADRHIPRADRSSPSVDPSVPSAGPSGAGRSRSAREVALPSGPPWMRPVRPPAAGVPSRQAGSETGTGGVDGAGGRADVGGGPAGSWPLSGGQVGPDGRLGGLGAFDPGRRGVKALAAVAAVVVLVAAVLAWQARPRTEPVSADPAIPADARPAGADAAGASGAGPGPGGSQASGALPVVVAVGGKVRRPGLVRLPPGARVADALQAAGGADGGVDVALLNLARKVVDGELILVGVTPPPGAAQVGAAQAGAAQAGAAPAGGAPAGAGARPPGAPVNLNTATTAELDTLPGVGPVLAQRIVDHRQQHGAFTAVSDLRTVEGIGGSRYDQLKDLVTV